MVSHGVGEIKLVCMGANLCDYLEGFVELIFQLFARSRSVDVIAVKPYHVSKIVARGGNSVLVCLFLMLCLSIPHF